MENNHLIYNDAFYDGQVAKSYESANIYAEIILDILPYLRSVADIGCGRGTWLKAFQERGILDLYGYDGDWVNEADLIVKNTNFRNLDLANIRIDSQLQVQVDIAISLEVAEHIPIKNEDKIVELLSAMSDTILFSAAYTGQGGQGHINEKYHSEWARKFSIIGYSVFDIFRPKLWRDTRIPFWYRQNVFLYVKTNSNNYKSLIEKNINPLHNLDFMDCPHPDLYNLYLTKDCDISVRNAAQLILRRLPQIAKKIIFKNDK